MIEWLRNVVLVTSANQAAVPVVMPLALRVSSSSPRLRSTISVSISASRFFSTGVSCLVA